HLFSTLSLHDALPILVLAISAACLAQKDPGLRAGLPGAGAPLNGFTPIELSMFQEGVQRAIQLEAWATQGVPNPDLFEAKVGGTDRKSTRLNSSHLVT